MSHVLRTQTASRPPAAENNVVFNHRSTPGEGGEHPQWPSQSSSFPTGRLPAHPGWARRRKNVRRQRRGRWRRRHRVKFGAAGETEGASSWSEAIVAFPIRRRRRLASIPWTAGTPLRPRYVGHERSRRTCSSHHQWCVRAPEACPNDAKYSLILNAWQNVVWRAFRTGKHCAAQKTALPLDAYVTASLVTGCSRKRSITSTPTSR